MKRIFTSLLFISFISCNSKDEIITPDPVLPAAMFKAKFDGTEKSFDTANAYAAINNGVAEITIIAEKKITQDSTITVKFTIPDFTKANASVYTKTLGGTNVYENVFVESKNTVSGGFQAWINPYQSGKLDVSLHDKNYLDGSFNFVYFLFDKYANKLGEVNVTEGTFTNVKIKQN